MGGLYCRVQVRNRKSPTAQHRGRGVLLDSRDGMRHDTLMASQEPTLTELAQRGEIQAMEDRWLTVIEDGGAEREELLEALGALNRRGETERAAALGWTWLVSLKERVKPADALALGRELLLGCGDSDDLRVEVLGLYQQNFADHPQIETLIEASGLVGGKSPRRALRTLDICLGLAVGAFLVNRSDERVAEIVAIDQDTCTYTVRSAQEDETLDADSLALAYDAADANDFRVLLQRCPEKLAELLQSDPVSFVIGILQSRGGSIDSDHLESLLSGRFIPADKWGSWWSKARTALRRCPHVVLEGRNPVILTYHAEGQTLEDEIEPQWAETETTAQRLTLVETYLREAKARRVTPKPAMIQRMRKDLQQRVDLCRKGAPSEALAEAIVIDRLAEGAKLPGSAGSPAREILDESNDLTSLLGRLDDHRFYTRAIDLIRELRPNDWQDIYARLLPTAPLEACEPISRALHESGRLEELRRIVREIPSDFMHHLDAICWLWRGPSIDDLEPLPRREMLPRMLEHLAQVTRSDHTTAEILRNARTKIRAALSANDYRHYRKLIEQMEPGLASTIHRTVDRAQGLGQVVHSTLLQIVKDTYPQLFVKAKVDPWLDENIIFCTRHGRQRHNAALSHLVNVKVPENAKAIGEAAAHGDLSENSEYKFALEERDLLQARIARMQQDLSRARLLTEDDISTDQVNIGTRVTVATVEGDQRETITILGPWEADTDRSIYNYGAPLCQQFKALKVGDTITLDRDGAQRAYRIEAIENALETPNAQ